MNRVFLPLAAGAGQPGLLDRSFTTGTFTLANGLTLSPTRVIDHELGTVSDRVDVTGDLTLAGTLEIAAGPGFGPGSYPLITYTGTGRFTNPLPPPGNAFYRVILLP